MTETGFVIQPGQTIPEDVTAFTSHDGEKATRAERSTETGAPWLSAACAQCIGHDVPEFRQPLTVTAVRGAAAKSVSGLCEVGADGWTCIVADAKHREIYHSGSTLGDVAATLNAEPRQPDLTPERQCTREDAHGGHVWQGGTVDFWCDGFVGRAGVPAVEPQANPCPDKAPHEAHEHSGFARPDGVPPAQCPGVPEPQQPDASGLLDLVRQYGDHREHNQCAEDDCDVARALFDRIAALIPQQPVHARDVHGEPLWMTQSGAVIHHGKQPAPDWRPLLVGGDPAPEGWLSPEDAETLRAVIDQRGDLIAQVMAELGVDRPEDVLGALAIIRTNRDQWLAQAKHYRKQRDEARRENQKVRELLAMAELGVPSTRPPAEPGPLRLTLPEVPPGAILVGARTQRHWIWSEAFQLWVTENDKRNLGDLLSFEGEVEVRLAPPREPRTWPKLDDAPEGVTAVRGLSGRIYRPQRGFWVWRDGDDEVSCDSFASLQNYDGPLTEVLDEPGATS